MFGTDAFLSGIMQNLNIYNAETPTNITKLYLQHAILV